MAAVFLAGQIIAYIFLNDQYVLIVQHIGSLIGCKPQNAVFHEDQTVADGNGRIHGYQAKLGRARRLTAIHLHVVHGAEQRWEQDWDIGDMDGDDGAGNAANDCKACKHDPLTVFDQTRDLFCKQGSKSGIGERRGKCAEQKVSQGVFTVFVQAPDDIAEYF